MILEMLRSYVEKKAMSHPRYSWATSSLPLSRVNYSGILQNGRNANLLVAGTTWIAKHFTEPPVRLWQSDADGTEHPFTGAAGMEFLRLLENPNPFFTGVELELAYITDLLYDGNGYLRKIRNPDSNKPDFLFWLPSWTCEPKWDDKNTRAFITHYEYKPDPSVDGEKIPVEDIVHFRWIPDPQNPRKGISPIKSLLREIYSDEKASNFVSALLRNMGIPGVILAPADNDTTEPLNSADVAAMKQEFMNLFSGDNIGAPMVLDAELNVHKLSFSPDELDLSALREVPEERMSAILGIYPEVVGLGAGSDTADFTEMLEASYMSTVMFLQRLITPKLKYDLLADFVATSTLNRLQVVYDNTNVQILSRLMNEKAKRFGLGILYGWIEVAEGRHEFGLPVRDEDRIYLRRKGTYAVQKNNVLEESIPEGDPAAGGPLSEGPAGESPEDSLEMSSDLPIVLETIDDLEEFLAVTHKRNGANV